MPSSCLHSKMVRKSVMRAFLTSSGLSYRRRRGTPQSRMYVCAYGIATDKRQPQTGSTSRSAPRPFSQGGAEAKAIGATPRNRGRGVFPRSSSRMASGPEGRFLVVRRAGMDGSGRDRRGKRETGQRTQTHTHRITSGEVTVTNEGCVGGRRHGRARGNGREGRREGGREGGGEGGF